MLEFTVNDVISLSADCAILDKDPLGTGKARPVNRGSAGVVYRASYKGLPRAIKFLSPDVTADEQGQLELNILESEFAKEIRLLCDLRHTNLARIVDFGTLQKDDKAHPYYVMEYVEGDRFDKFQQTCAPGDFLRLLDELLDAMSYLHNMGYFHMDIKEENIIVQVLPGAKPHLTLVDLGGAKRVFYVSQAQLRANTVYISSDKATRPERRSMLGKKIPRAQLAAWGVDLDLYAIGSIIERALGNSVMRAKLEAELSNSGTVGLEWLIARLTEGSSDDSMDKRYYKSSQQVREDLQRLQPSYTWALGLPELSPTIGPSSIQLSVNRVGLTPSLLDVVSHPLFQRLRNIPQLDYVHLIYPGAKQSRFQHSLATFRLGRAFVSRLLEYPEFRMVVTPDYVEAFLLVALLHDIGHYPLSHMFEDFVAEPEVYRNQAEAILPDHEVFRHIVCPSTHALAVAIGRGLAAHGNGSETLDRLLEKCFRKSCGLLPELMYPRRDSSTQARMLHGILDSAIDIDKIAYLADDSLSSGVPYGQGLDVDGLLQSLVPPRGDDRERGAIAITEDGLAAAESIVLARFWMIARVYWHRTNRAIMAMHKFVIADLMHSGLLDFTAYFEETLFMAACDATRLLAARFGETHRSLGPGKSIRNPLAGLLDGRRDLYKRLLTITNGPCEADRLLYTRIIDEGPMNSLTVGEKIRDSLSKGFAGLELRYGDVIVDMPRKRRDLLGSNVLVYLDRAPDKGRNLCAGEAPVSPVLKGLPEDFEQNVKKFRIFVHPDKMLQLRKSSMLDEARDYIRAYLLDYYGIQPDLAT